MKDFASWFNAEEYFDFLTESSLLFEVNIPLQKQKFENRKKLFQFRAGKARQEGILKMELARDESRAKARGIQMGLGEHYQEKLMNEFLDKLIEERTPLKSEKRKMRPEVDPADRERDRKRESRKQDKMTGLGNVLIVKHRGMNRVEIIEKGDFDPKSHELIKGKTKNGDKGRVTIQDLQNYSQRSDFRNTKTSIRILGKIQKQVEDEQAQAQAEAQESGEGGQPQQQMQMAPPPPPRPRAPSDGKEITDEASTYPDWDHQINQMAAMLPEILNTLTGTEMSAEAQQALSDSRTLGDSLNRFVVGFQETFPSAEEFKYELLTEPQPAGKWYSKKIDQDKAAPVATFIGKGKETIGFNLKIGKQIRICNKGESGIVFDAIMSKIKPENITDFTVLYQDVVDDLRKTLNNRTTYLPANNTGEKSLISDLMLNKLKSQESVSKQKQLTDKFKELIETFVNQNDAIKIGYIAESLTGNMRFDSGMGSAQFTVITNKDGTDTKVIQLTPEFFEAIAKSTDTNINLKFAQVKVSGSSPFVQILQNVGQINEGTQDALAILDQIKGEVADPRKLMKMFGIEIVDAVFSTPLDLREYHFEDSDSTNTIIINPGSSSEEIVTIPVKTNYTPDGKEQNYIERGADELLESYLLMNDYLVDMIKNNSIDVLDALLTLEEEFDILAEKRNYRKEYDNYHSKPKQRANRSKRVLARRKMMKKGKVSKGDGKDVDHKDGNPQNNSDKNLRVLSKSKNRSMNEDHGAGFMGTSKLLKKYLKDTPNSKDPTCSEDEIEYEEDKYVE